MAKKQLLIPVLENAMARALVAKSERLAIWSINVHNTVRFEDISHDDKLILCEALRIIEKQKSRFHIHNIHEIQETINKIINEKS